MSTTPTGPAQEPSDTEMLDWLEQNRASIHHPAPHMSGRGWTVLIESLGGSMRVRARSPRHAIAAAMKQLSERPPATAQGGGGRNELAATFIPLAQMDSLEQLGCDQRWWRGSSQDVHQVRQSRMELLMTTWNDFYESLDGNGWFRREGMTTICGGGVESRHAPRRSKVCGGALILAQGAVSEAEHYTTCKQAGRLDTDNHLASGSCYDRPERSQSRSSDRPAAISGRGRWDT